MKGHHNLQPPTRVVDPAETDHHPQVTQEGYTTSKQKPVAIADGDVYFKLAKNVR